jgi:hypothetical protein
MKIDMTSKRATSFTNKKSVTDDFYDDQKQAKSHKQRSFEPTYTFRIICHETVKEEAFGNPLKSSPERRHQ